MEHIATVMRDKMRSTIQVGQIGLHDLHCMEGDAHNFVNTECVWDSVHGNGSDDSKSRRASPLTRSSTKNFEIVHMQRCISRQANSK